MLLDAIDHHPDMGFLVNDVIISLCIRKKLSFGLNTILFQKYFKYTCIIDIQQIDQDLFFFFFGLNTILFV